MSRTLSEHESKRLLAGYGVPFAPERVVANPDDAVRAADELGMPVAVKLAGDNIAHKTERGLVRLGLSGASEVERAATDLLALARPEDGAVALLVAPMLTGSRELIAGVHADEQFGPCVMIGLGGVLAEVVSDVAFRLVPIEPVDVEEMLDELRGSAALGAVRGESAVDRDAIASLVLGLSELAATRDDVLSVDVNPVIVVDGTPIAVDALVELADAPS